MARRVRIYAQGTVWYVETFDEEGFRVRKTPFIHCNGAFNYCSKYIEQVERALKAHHLVSITDTTLLTVAEFSFWKKMVKSYRVITKRQYGYLRGLAERNPL